VNTRVPLLQVNNSSSKKCVPFVPFFSIARNMNEVEHILCVFQSLFLDWSIYDPSDPVHGKGPPVTATDRKEGQVPESLIHDFKV